MHQLPQQQFVTVLSFSRSGSSLLAQLLDRVCGISFGETVEHQPATAANPEGYFENEQIVRINDAILQAGGGSVFQPPDVNFCLTLSSEQCTEFVHQIRMAVELSACGRRHYGWKDPRTAYTLPVWRLALHNVKAVILVRSPGAASASYEAQYGTRRALASSLWFDSYFRIFLHSAGLQRYVLSFEDLVAKPLETLLPVARFLDVDLDEADAERRIRRTLRAELVHFSSGAEPDLFSAHIDPAAKVLYQYVRTTLERGAQPDYDLLGSLLTGLHTYDRMHGRTILRRSGDDSKTEAPDDSTVRMQQLIREQSDELARLRTGLQYAEKLAFERLEELGKYDRALGEAHAAIAERDAHIAQLLTETDRVQESPAERAEAGQET